MIYVPSRMGQLNRRALIRQLQKFGVASRADLAKALGMSQPTAGKIVDELIAMEVIEEAIMTALPADKLAARGVGDPVGPLGRPGRKLRLNQSRVQFLGIHLGVNTTMLAGLTLGASGEDRWPVAFEIGGADASPAKAWEKKLRQAANSLGDDEYLGVLLSAPGVVDEEENRVLFSPNMHWTEKNDIAAIIGRIWDVPVLLVQEERALALGHHLADPDFEDFLLVDFGEGVGGAIIVEGNPFASPLPISGEIGHTPVPGNVRPCGCGAVGCVETLISVRGLLESFSAAAPTVDHSWSGLGDYISQNGIKPWLARALDLAAAAIAGALNVLGLRRVVVTGSLTELPPVVMEHLAHAVRNGAMWARFGKVECVSAPRRRTAGMVAMGIDRLVLPEVKRESPTAGLRPLAEYTWSGAKSTSPPKNPTPKKKKT